MAKDLQFLWQQFRFKHALTTAAVVGAVAGSVLIGKASLKPFGLDKLTDFLLAAAVIEASRRCAFSAIDAMDMDADLAYTERRVLIANHTENLRQIEPEQEEQAVEEAASDEPALEIIDDVVAYWQQQQKHLMVIGGTGAGKTYFMTKFVQKLKNFYIKVYDIDATKDDWKVANLVANRYPDIEAQMIADLSDIDKVADERDRIGSSKWKPKQQTLIICDEFPVTIDALKKTAPEWSGTHAKRTRKLGRFIAILVQNDTVKNTGLKGDNGVRDSCYVRVYLGVDAIKRAKQLQDKRILAWLQAHNAREVCLVDDRPAYRVN
jgi:hypothetical protein